MEPRQKHSSRAVANIVGFILEPKMIYCKFRHIPTENTYKKNIGYTAFLAMSSLSILVLTFAIRIKTRAIQ